MCSGHYFVFTLTSLADHVPIKPMSAKRARRMRFKPDEDRILMDLVMRYGCDSWSWIASRLPGRNARQCRDRWNHYLLPLAPRDPCPSQTITRYPAPVNFYPIQFGQMASLDPQIPEVHLDPIPEEKIAPEQGELPSTSAPEPEIGRDAWARLGELWSLEAEKSVFAWTDRL
jgi:hypothetical protein